MRNKLVIFLVLFAINALIYSCGISNNFINLDDYIYVGHNVKVQSISLKNIKWAFTTIYFGHYSPLLWLSYMLDYYIGSGEAIIFHIHNLIIHIINAYLVFLCTNLILTPKFNPKLLPSHSSCGFISFPPSFASFFWKRFSKRGLLIF